MNPDRQPQQCGHCGKNEYNTSIMRVSCFPRKELPDEYDALCRPCAEQLDEFDPANLTDDELIAAIISDSIGYASPRHAAFHVRDYRDGETGVHCERGHAIFDGDLLALMESAGRHWLGKSEQDKQRLLAKVQRWAELEDEDRMAGVTLSMMMPVGGL